MRITRLVSSILLLFASISSLYAVELPRAVAGQRVYDFANLLPPGTESELQNKLLAYEEQTSIQIAVVTVPSLQGLTVEEYTLNLATSWGVGQKKKDNGAVFLIAPNERKMRIEVGYGLEADLTDAKASRIVRSDNGPVASLFKEGKMSEGIVLGVSMMLETLGSTPFEARAEERRLAKIEQTSRVAESAENTKAFLLTFFVILLIAGALSGTIFWIRRSIRRGKELEQTQMKISFLINYCYTIVEQIAGAHLKLQKELDLFRLEAPQSAWEKIEAFLENQSNTSENHSLKTRALERKLPLIKRLDDAKALLQEVTDCHGEALTILGEYTSLIGTADAFRLARKRSPGELERFVEEFSATYPLSSHPDVLSDTRTIFRKAEDLRGYAVGKAAMDSNPDWLIIAALLSSAFATLSEASSKAKEDIAYAERARKEGPRLYALIPTLLWEARSAIAQSDVSSETKALVPAAEEKIAGAEKAMLPGVKSWVPAFTLLVEASALLKSAIERAVNDRREAEEERERTRRRKAAAAAAAASRRSIGSSGGLRGSSFGGGRFGGGGASGKW